MLKKIYTILTGLIIILTIKDVYDAVKTYRSRNKVLNTPVTEKKKKEKRDASSLWKNRKYTRIG